MLLFYGISGCSGNSQPQNGCVRLHRKQVKLQISGKQNCYNNNDSINNAMAAKNPWNTGKKIYKNNKKTTHNKLNKKNNVVNKERIKVRKKKKRQKIYDRGAAYAINHLIAIKNDFSFYRA